MPAVTRLSRHENSASRRFPSRPGADRQGRRLHPRFRGRAAPRARRAAAKAPPARDIAGLLRSIDYAVSAALARAPNLTPEERATLTQRTREWGEHARRAATGMPIAKRIGPSALWPSDDAQAQRLLDLFLLEKALYEIEYELTNRPSWAAIPMDGDLAHSSSSAEWSGHEHAVARPPVTIIAGPSCRSVPLSRPAHRERQDASCACSCRRRAASWPSARTASANSTAHRRCRTVRGPVRRSRITGCAPDSATTRSSSRTPTASRRCCPTRPLSARRRQPLAALRKARRASDAARRRRTASASWCLAPNARRVSVVGDFNFWDGRRHAMRVRGNGYWEIFVPGARAGDKYKYEIIGRNGALLPLKSDPVGLCRRDAARDRLGRRRCRQAAAAARRRRAGINALDQPMSIYEVHLGSWRRKGEHGQLADLSRTRRATAGLCRATWASPTSNCCR